MTEIAIIMTKAVQQAGNRTRVLYVCTDRYYHSAWLDNGVLSDTDCPKYHKPDNQYTGQRYLTWTWVNVATDTNKE